MHEKMVNRVYAASLELVLDWNNIATQNIAWEDGKTHKSMLRTAITFKPEP